MLAAGLWAVWEFTVDDAFITWRYAANWAAGYGPVWNPGQDPVEGFTNFAWTAWHAGALALGLDPGVVAKLTSALLAAATGYLLATVPASRTGRITAVAAFLLFAPTYLHTAAGLETMAFAAVLLRAVVVAVRALGGVEPRVWELPALLLLAGMLRPDGVAAAAPALLAWLAATRHRRPAVVSTAVAATLGGAYFAWRWQFYGHLFPNTFYVKFGSGSGVEWLQVTAAALLPLIVLTGALLVRRDTARVGALLTATVGAAWAVYVLSGPSMDYVHRFAFHAFPVLCLGAGLALSGDVPRRVAAGVAAVAVGWVALAGVTADDLPIVLNYGPDLSRAHVPIGQALAAAEVPPAARTLATSDAGAIPYYSGWATLDYIGLNDEAIAQGADVDARFAEVSPTVVVVTSDRPTPPGQMYGLDLGRALAGYEQVGAVQMRDSYFQLVYVVPEHAAAVRPVLAQVVGQAQAVHDPGRYELTVDRWIDRLLGRT